VVDVGGFKGALEICDWFVFIDDVPNIGITVIGLFSVVVDWIFVLAEFEIVFELHTAQLKSLLHDFGHAQ